MRARRSKGVISINSEPSTTATGGTPPLVAYAAVHRELRVRVRVYVGLSDEPCCWHVPDGV